MARKTFTLKSENAALPIQVQLKRRKSTRASSQVRVSIFQEIQTFKIEILDFQIYIVKMHGCLPVYEFFSRKSYLVV